jgi:glycosyltransferase involved in cell wall biosynthesis
LKILIVHNFYQQAGGEDQVFLDEAALLQSHGHTVLRHTVDNDDIDHMSRLTIAGKSIWNSAAHHQLLARVSADRPAIVHFHNTFPLLSPAVYSAARRGGAAVVQTLHNYRLICPNAVFFRDGGPCEDCLGKTIPWPAVVHGCYRGSRLASAGVATMLATHRLRGTFHDDVDVFINLTRFARDKFIEAGFCPDRLMIKPNFVTDPAAGHADDPAAPAQPADAEPYLLFVARLSAGKGVAVLLDAWKQLRPNIQLRVVGDGELADTVRAAAAADPRIQYLGQQPIETVQQLMAGATALVFPSLWYECQPKTVIEALAAGTPVIASDRGAAAGMIDPGRTGLHFTAGNPAALAAAVEQLLSNPARLPAMRTAARLAYQASYTADQNYARLMEIYQSALDRRAAANQGLSAEPAGSRPRECQKPRLESPSSAR